MLQITSKATTQRLVARHIAAVDATIANSQIETLRALCDRRITLDQLVDAERNHELGGIGVLASIAKREPLFPAMKAAIPKMGKSPETRKRYDQARRNLERKGKAFLSDKATVGDLFGIDWNALRESWGNSGSDWMHLRRFVSAFLTVHLGDVHHPFRRDVMKKIPTAEENEREPDVTPELFWKIIGNASEHVRAAFVTIVITGMRRSEYLRCTKEHLKPAIMAVQVPGRKTRKSSGTVMVDEYFWPWVEAGIPSPLQYKWLRLQWIKACEKTGVSDLHLHDLRHAMGQWATNEGVDESKVQEALRHASPAMTRRYTRQKAKGEVARAMGRALRSEPEQKHSAVNSMSLKVLKNA
jgi:integrase